MKETKKGISLIVLAITIAVMLILVAVVVLNIKEENVTVRATEVKVKNDISVFKEELNNWIGDQKLDSASEGRAFNTNSLEADENENSAKNDGKAITGVSNIYDIITSMPEDSMYAGNLIIEEGELKLVKVPVDLSTDEISWITSMIPQSTTN